jgi:hypothetical protein
VDDAAVVSRPDGTHAPKLERTLPGAYFASAAGPAGFAEAIERLFS